MAELAFFSISLIIVSAMTVFALAPPSNDFIQKTGAGQEMDPRSGPATTDPFSADARLESGHWGEMLVLGMQLELPEEYLGSEMNTTRRTEWLFAGMNPSQVADLMRQCGLTERQVSQLLSSPPASTANGTIVTPDDELIFALSPEVRARLYAELARNPANELMNSPIVLSDGFFDELRREGQLNSGSLSTLQSLTYRLHDFQCQYFSDFGCLMRRVASAKQRSLLLKVLSRQPAVGVQLRISPGTDIDKLLAYWTSPGVRAEEIRPLLESVGHVPNGGTISLSYLLPRFARERLFTYPLPTDSSAGAMNCYWTALNFFQETPDDRFANPDYALSYVTAHYRRIEQPDRLGDIVLFQDEQGRPVHAAIYIAGDVVFTKNGFNWKQPWTLARMKDLAANYLISRGASVQFFRKNDAL